MVTASASEPGRYQLTWADDEGPSGHTTRDTAEEAVSYALEEGYRLDTANSDAAREMVERVQKAREQREAEIESWLHPNEVTESMSVFGRREPDRKEIVEFIQEIKETRKSDWRLAEVLAMHFEVPEAKIVEWLNSHNVCPGATTRTMASKCDPSRYKAPKKAEGWLSRKLSGRPKREDLLKVIREIKRERRGDWMLAPTLAGSFGVPDATIVEWLRYHDICPRATTRSMASQCVIEDVESLPLPKHAGRMGDGFKVGEHVIRIGDMIKMEGQLGGYVENVDRSKGIARIEQDNGEIKTWPLASLLHDTAANRERQQEHNNQINAEAQARLEQSLADWRAR